MIVSLSDMQSMSFVLDIARCFALLLILLDKSNMSSNMSSLACTDHSDCIALGHRYGCLLYKCTDYTDPRLVLCGVEDDCEDGYQCYRHHILPIPSGLCLPSSVLHPCSFQADCHAVQEHHHCCGGWCCPTPYFRQVQPA